MGGPGMVALAGAFAHTTGLSYFYLQRSDIGVTGARALARSLAHNTTLTTLCLVTANVGRPGPRRSPKRWR